MILLCVVLFLQATQCSAVVRRFNGITSSADGQFLATTATSGNIWTSNDVGFTWIEQEATNNWFGIASSINGSRLAALGQNIWTSTNFGTSWNEHSVGGGSRGWTSIASSADGNWLAAVGTGIWTSKNKGMSWTQQTVGGGGTKTWTCIVSSADGNLLTATGTSGIWTSNDSGRSWTQQTIPGVSYFYGMTASAKGMLAATSGSTVWISQDTGATWQNHSLSSTTAGVTSVPSLTRITSSADGTRLAAVDVVPAGSYSSGIINVWTSYNSGTDWTKNAVQPVGFPSTPTRPDITSSADGMELALSSVNIWISHDAGTTWAVRSI